MSTHPACVRVLLTIACALTVSACAARSTVAAGPRPLPFPGTPVPSHTPTRITSPTRAIPMVDDIVATALAQRGAPYRMGGDSPDRGFDCSGFVRYVLAQHAVTMPRTTLEQFRTGARIKAADVKPGDLVFFTTVAPGPSHVGLVVGADQFVHAPASTGVVRVEPLSSSYWRQRFIGARRVLSE